LSFRTRWATASSRGSVAPADFAAVAPDDADARVRVVPLLFLAAVFLVVRFAPVDLLALAVERLV
jgi:hypothetical protein